MVFRLTRRNTMRYRESIRGARWMRIRDSIAERLEACGLYCRAASRWIEVMQRCLDDEDREWIRHHRNQCLKRRNVRRRRKRSLPTSTRRRKRLNIVWALRSPMAKHSGCPAKGKRPPSNAFLHDVCLTASPYPACGSSTGSNSVGPRKRMDCTPKVGHPTE